MGGEKRAAHIVGAGVCGLTLAYQLAKAGFEVVVLEKQPDVGGLARTFRYGDFSFDIGPHRFHTDIPRVGQFIRSILQDEGITILRQSSVYLFGKFHQWPLRPKSLVRLPKRALLSCFVDLFRRPPFQGERFDGYIKSKYGETLYRIFFRDYTLKYCWVDPAKLHYTWASASIDRAIIDKRASMDTLLDTLKVTLLPRPVTTEFLYPKHGVDVFSRRLAQKIEALGGKVRLGVSDISLQGAKGRIRKISYDGTTDEVDVLVWTAPITLLSEKLGLGTPKLRYLSLVAFNIQVGRSVPFGDQWIYFPSNELTLTRASFPQNFSRDMAPEGKSGVCVEITTLGPPDMAAADKKRGRIVQDLERVGICSPSDILDIHTEQIENAYPLYELGYQQERDRVMREFGRFENLFLCGRTGLFWYNNMDNSIDKAFSLAESIISGQTRKE